MQLANLNNELNECEFVNANLENDFIKVAGELKNQKLSLEE